MSSVDVSSESAASASTTKDGEFKLEVVVLPVSDVDRAKPFYEMLGWRLDAARADLVERGVDVSEPFHDVTGVFHHGGTDGRVSGPAANNADYGSFAAFSDPDGNGWLLQQIKTRLPGRVTSATFEAASDLAEALVRAEAAHGEHEKRTGVADPEWPRWYARYMIAEQTGQELPS